MFALRSRILGVAGLGLLLAGGCPPHTTTPTPEPAAQPAQPETGPGSTTISNGGLKIGRFGSAGTEYFIYEPTDPSPSTAPVIAFIHAYGAINPRAYGGWIRHMVSNGNIVIFPVYQTTLKDPNSYTPNALTALQDAFVELNNGSHVKPDLTRFALVSHSLGGPIAMNIAAVAAAQGLPTPKAAFITNPGDSDSVVAAFGTLQTDNYDQIPSSLRLIIIVGDQDQIANTSTATDLYNKVPQIPAGQREVIEFHSDSHGDPPLVANHGAPLAIDQAFDSGESLNSQVGTGQTLPPALADLQNAGSSNLTDALDFFGYWRYSDGLFNLAFAGTAALVTEEGVTDLSMGDWSDGTPVTPATVFLP